MPLVAKYFRHQGRAALEAKKLTMLAHEGAVTSDADGVRPGDESATHPGPHEMLLIERLRGVPVEAPARTPERWEQLKDQIVEALLAWHRHDSHGLVGIVDSTQENLWPPWYRQRVEVLWSTLGYPVSTIPVYPCRTNVRFCFAPANSWRSCLPALTTRAC